MSELVRVRIVWQMQMQSKTGAHVLIDAPSSGLAMIRRGSVGNALHGLGPCRCEFIEAKLHGDLCSTET